LRFSLPYYQKRGDTEKATVATNTVFVTTGILHATLAVILLLLTLRHGFSAEVKFGLVCMAFCVLIDFYIHHIITILRAEQKFSLIARYNYIDSAVVFVVTIPLLYWFRIYGVFMAILLSRVILCALIYWQVGLRATLAVDWKRYCKMIRQGFPIMISDFCIDLIMTSDRIIITVLLGQTALGFYGIAIMILAILIQLPGTAREIMEPQVMRNMDGRHTAAFVDDYLLKPLVNTAYLIPFLIGPVCLGLPVAIPMLLPQYLPGIVPTQVIALGVFFLALAFVPRPIIVANAWQAKISRYLVVILATNVGVSIGLVKAGYGILGVAIGSSLSFALLFLTLFTFIARRLHSHSNNLRGHLLALALPFPVMCLVLFVLSRTIPHFISNDILCGGLQVVIYMGVMGGFHLISSRSFSLLNALTLWR
jgi:O-antigen/teichoic acid export membrane protein